MIATPFHVLLPSLTLEYSRSYLTLPLLGSIRPRTYDTVKQLNYGYVTRYVVSNYYVLVKSLTN